MHGDIRNAQKIRVVKAEGNVQPGGLDVDEEVTETNPREAGGGGTGQNPVTVSCEQGNNSSVP